MFDHRKSVQPRVAFAATCGTSTEPKKSQHEQAIVHAPASCYNGSQHEMTPSSNKLAAIYKKGVSQRADYCLRFARVSVYEREANTAAREIQFSADAGIHIFFRKHGPPKIGHPLGTNAFGERSMRCFFKTRNATF